MAVTVLRMAVCARVFHGFIDGRQGRLQFALAQQQVRQRFQPKSVTGMLLPVEQTAACS